MDFEKDFNRFARMARSVVSKLFLSATQIWVWWTPRDPSLKQRMKK